MRTTPTIFFQQPINRKKFLNFLTGNDFAQGDFLTNKQRINELFVTSQLRRRKREKKKKERRKKERRKKERKKKECVKEKVF